MADYGYENAQPDYGYGDSQPGYGYGETQPGAEVEYGYGDAAPQDAAPRDVPAARPRRRCSVTKFSFDQSSEGTQEAEMARQLHSVDIINQLRNGGGPASMPLPKDDMTAATEALSDWSIDEDQPKKVEKSKKKASRQKSRSRRS